MNVGPNWYIIPCCNYCDITDFRRVPPERATYKKFIKTLKNHTSLD